jgi:methylglutaconyl-CoA hydratase
MGRRAAVKKPSESIEVEVQHGVGIVWLNRPELRNAFDEAMIAALTRAFTALDRDRGVRAVVIAGRGSAFCAGGDLNWMKRTASWTTAQNERDAFGLATMLATLARLSKPTIARVHGPAFAGGLGLVAACDIAVAAIGIEFCASEVRLGLVPATIGPYVVAALGERAAHRYFLTAERFDSAEAYRLGLVHELVPADELDATVNALLGHLVQGGPAALAATKDLIRAIAGKPVDAKLMRDTAKRIARARASEEGKEGVGAFLAKRRASWVPKL